MGLASGVRILFVNRKIKIAQRPSARRTHGLTAVALALPVLLTVVTGVAYRLLRMHGFNHVKWLRGTHQSPSTAARPGAWTQQHHSCCAQGEAVTRAFLHLAHRTSRRRTEWHVSSSSWCRLLQQLWQRGHWHFEKERGSRRGLLRGDK